MPCLISESLDGFALCLLFILNVVTGECQATEEHVFLSTHYTADVNWCSKKIGSFQSVVTFVCSLLIHTPLLLTQIVKSYDMPLESPGNYLVMFLLAFMTVYQVHNALKK